MNQPDFTERQKEIIALLTEGKTNKEIAHSLNISERTVEDHLNHIYAILEVSSRAEALIKLLQSDSSNFDDKTKTWKSTGEDIDDQTVDSTVANNGGVLYRVQTFKHKKVVWIGFIVIGVIGMLFIVLWLSQTARQWSYEREAEYPDEFTVGQYLDRTDASRGKVHGQFGTQSFEPWAPQAGFVKYYNIQTPQSGMLYLQIRYSKHSQSSVPILIYLDDEQNPRGSIYPIDQGDWNKFSWTELIQLGDIKSGIHAIKFYTIGQEYGVADLDKFVLSTQPP